MILAGLSGHLASALRVRPTRTRTTSACGDVKPRRPVLTGASLCREPRGRLMGNTSFSCCNCHRRHRLTVVSSNATNGGVPSSSQQVDNVNTLVRTTRSTRAAISSWQRFISSVLRRRFRRRLWAYAGHHLRAISLTASTANPQLSSNWAQLGRLLFVQSQQQLQQQQ